MSELAGRNDFKITQLFFLLNWLEILEIMKKFLLGSLKVFLTTFLYACIWSLIYPYSSDELTPLDFFYLIGYTIPTFVMYSLLKILFWIFRKNYSEVLSFPNIFIAILSLWSLFHLIYMPYGPDLGIFEYFRNL